MGRLLFPSAPELFDGMRKVMMKCASFNIHQTMWEIFGVFKATIQLYTQTLESRVRKGPLGEAFTEDQLKTACAVIGTLEYVDTTLPQVCDSMREHIISWILIKSKKRSGRLQAWSIWTCWWCPSRTSSSPCCRTCRKFPGTSTGRS